MKITDFISQHGLPDSDLAAALRVIERYKSFESGVEFLSLPFMTWMKLERLQEYLDHLVNHVPLRNDTLEYMKKG